MLFVGLAGKTELEKARADMIVDCIDDVSREIVKLFSEKDESKKVSVFQNIIVGFKSKAISAHKQYSVYQSDGMPLPHQTAGWLAACSS